MDLFLFLYDLTRLLQRIEKICYLFYWWTLLVLFCFLTNQENLYMIDHDLDLFCDIFNTITNIIEDKPTTSHCLQIILISVFKWIKKFFYNFICYITNHDFCVIPFECITCSSSLWSLEEIKLIVIVKCVFHVSDYLRSFMMLFK